MMEGRPRYEVSVQMQDFNLSQKERSRVGPGVTVVTPNRGKKGEQRGKIVNHMKRVYIKGHRKNNLVRLIS